MSVLYNSAPPTACRCPQPTLMTGDAERVILVAAGEWRTRRFVSTVLRYSTRASVIEAAGYDAAWSKTTQIPRPVDFLISEIELSSGKSGIDLAYRLTDRNASLKVILMSFRSGPPAALRPGWRFLSIPFPTGVFLQCLEGVQSCRPLQLGMGIRPEGGPLSDGSEGLAGSDCCPLLHR